MEATTEAITEATTEGDHIIKIAKKLLNDFTQNYGVLELSQHDLEECVVLSTKIFVG